MARWWVGSRDSPRTRRPPDVTGLLYRRARYYDPITGLFTQIDPIGLAGGLNLYGYANGDPVNFRDPSGLCPEWLTGRPCGGAVSLGAGFVPGVSSGLDAATLFSGEDPLTGESVGFWGRAAASLGLITPLNGGAVRKGAGLLSSAGRSLRMRSFTRGNYRHNLIVRTGRNPAGHHAHHIFPQRFEARFRAAGINPHDPAYLAWWEGGDHLANAHEWNHRWRIFLATNPSREEILEFAGNLAAEFGLPAAF